MGEGEGGRGAAFHEGWQAAVVSSAMSLVRPAHRARSILGGAWGVGLSMCPTRALDNTGSPLPEGTMADPSSPPVLGLRLQGHRWPAATQTQRSPTLARALDHYPPPTNTENHNNKSTRKAAGENSSGAAQLPETSFAFVKS